MLFFVEDFAAEHPEHFVDGISKLQATILNVDARESMPQVTSIHVCDAANGAGAVPRPQLNIRH